MPASVRSRARALLAPTLAGDEEGDHFESPIVSGTRGERLVAWQATPFPSADGTVGGVFLSGLDVTDRERKQEGREQLLNELGQVKFALDQVCDRRDHHDQR